MSANTLEPQTEREFLKWFKDLALANCSVVDEIIIEGSGAIVRIKNGRTFEINIANHYNKKAAIVCEADPEKEPEESL